MFKVFQTVRSHRTSVSKWFKVAKLVHDTYQNFCASLDEIFNDQLPPGASAQLVG
jgi:hypothetical protein